ncbi:MAG: hypothetical protein AABW80_03700 [Nanoarchaeota archaeon]
MSKANRRKFKKDLRAFLSEAPANKILFWVSPPVARDHGILPISLSADGETLHVIGREGSQDKMPAYNALNEMYRKHIVVEGYVEAEVWDRAYRIFYEGMSK